MKPSEHSQPLKVLPPAWPCVLGVLGEHTLENKLPHHGTQLNTLSLDQTSNIRKGLKTKLQQYMHDSPVSGECLAHAHKDLVHFFVPLIHNIKIVPGNEAMHAQ